MPSCATTRALARLKTFAYEYNGKHADFLRIEDPGKTREGDRIMKRTRFEFKAPSVRVILSGLALVLAAGTWRPAPTLAQLPPGTPVYNANAKWVTDRGSQVFNVMAYGAKCDGVTDDAAAINAAISAANPGWTPTGSATPAGVTQIPGGCAIGSTVLAAGIVEGIGYGVGTGTGAAKSYLKWIGAAGSPMMTIGGWNTSIRDLAFVGNASALPSEAILCDNVNGYCDNGSIYNVYLGAGMNGVSGNQFVNGITFNGTSGGDSINFNNVHIGNVTGACINNPTNNNASDNEIDNLYLNGCGVGVLYQGELTGKNWEFGANVTDDFVLGEAAGGSAPFVYVRGFTGGLTPQFAKIYAGTLQIDSGSWQVSSSTISPAIDVAELPVGSIILQNFGFVGSGSLGPWPTVSFCPASGTVFNTKIAEFDNVGGLRPTDVSCPAPSADGRTAAEVVFKSMNNSGYYGTLSRNMVTWETGAFDWRRYDFEHEVDHWGGPVVVRSMAAPADPACSATGSGSASYGYRIAAISGGASFPGETLPTAEVTCSNASKLGSSNTNTVSWIPVVGATGYNVYCRTPSAELLCTTVWNNGTIHGNPSWVDNGSATPSGALPSANTTGRLIGMNDYFSGGSYFHTQEWNIDGLGNASFQTLKVGGISPTFTVASGTAAMGTSSIGSGACASAVSVAATGVLKTDTIKYTPNADPTGVTGYGASATGAVVSIYAYPTAGYVNFKVCNSTSGAITPGALTLNWEVTR
jgi:hypothetical protein